MGKDSFQNIIQSEQLVLIDFFATWCGPCMAMLPALEQVATEMADEVRVIKIDIDKNMPLAVAQKVMGVPTLMLYKNGELLWKEAGTQSAASLKKIIAAHA